MLEPFTCTTGWQVVMSLLHGADIPFTINMQMLHVSVSVYKLLRFLRKTK